MPDQPHIYLHCVNCVSAAGVTLEATKEALFSDKPKALTVYPGLLGEIALAYGLVNLNWYRRVRITDKFC